MIEEANLKTYLSISPSKFGIYLIDIKSFNYFYKQEIKVENKFNSIDLDSLSKFLEAHVFNIEKLTGKFLNIVSLIIDSEEIVEIKIGIKKKNYHDNINKNFLENLIIDGKDLFKDNFQNEKVLHIAVNRYLVDGISYSSFNENLKGNDFCMELQFIFISSKFASDISKVIEKYHIKITGYLDQKYIEAFITGKDVKLCEMAYKIENGHNDNEVKFISKSKKNVGFFEKFFQLFS